MAAVPCVVLGLVAIFMLPWRTLCTWRSDLAFFQGLNCYFDMANMKRQRARHALQAPQGRPGAHVIHHP
jgi:hypothetical protein